MITDDVKHQAHTAPMTNGSRYVRYSENNTPNSASGVYSASTSDRNRPQSQAARIAA